MSSPRCRRSIEGHALKGAGWDPEGLFGLKGSNKSLQTCLLTPNLLTFPGPERQPMLRTLPCTGSPRTPFSMSAAFHLVQEGKVNDHHPFNPRWQKERACFYFWPDLLQSWSFLEAEERWQPVWNIVSCRLSRGQSVPFSWRPSDIDFPSRGDVEQDEAWMVSV